MTTKSNFKFGFTSHPHSGFDRGRLHVGRTPAGRCRRRCNQDRTARRQSLPVSGLITMTSRPLKKAFSGSPITPTKEALPWISAKKEGQDIIQETGQTRRCRDGIIRTRIHGNLGLGYADLCEIKTGYHLYLHHSLRPERPQSPLQRQRPDRLGQRRLSECLRRSRPRSGLDYTAADLPLRRLRRRHRFSGGLPTINWIPAKASSWMSPCRNPPSPPI